VVELSPSLDLWGERFSPREAEAATGLALSDKTEPGALGTAGRYRGVPVPYGSATLEPPASVPPTDRLGWLLATAAPHAEALRGLGAELWRLHVDVRYQAQCNLEFSPEEVAAVAALRVPFTVTCWEDAEWGAADAEPGAAPDRRGM
jgi:hypothetical protein